RLVAAAVLRRTRSRAAGHGRHPRPDRHPTERAAGRRRDRARGGAGRTAADRPRPLCGSSLTITKLITKPSSRSGPARVVTLCGGRLSVLVRPRMLRCTVLLVGAVL